MSKRIKTGAPRGIKQIHRHTFKQGSKTYFNSSLFFPKEVRRDVFVLYGFVRVADNFVDLLPADAKGFYRFKGYWERALEGEKAGDPIIDDFLELYRRLDFEPGWVTAFLRAMEMDLYKKQYDGVEETLEYIYGSAEVIGLFMARILHLSPASYPAARMLGRSMQYINFIRDLDEDCDLGRRYLSLRDTGLSTLDRQTARREPERFRSFIQRHLALYRDWQAQGEQGYAYLPLRYRIPIKTAADMYNWTARRIARHPLVVFRRQVKPSKMRIWLRLLANLLGI